MADKPSIPFLDLGATYAELHDEFDDAYQRVMNSGWYVLGNEVAAFEAEWATFTEAEHCIGVGNGFDALTLALRALDVGPGDEVIVPSNTYIATWLAVSALGAHPVAVEPDPATHNIDPTQLERAITARTKVILPVHLYGQPACLDLILSLAHAHGIAVVEDAAQAHGARFHGKRIGAQSDAVCWSFYPGKNLGAFGDGGAVTTNRADIADQIAVLRNYGSRTKYVNEVPGVNSRLDELQAAFLRVKVTHLDAWNARRRSIAQLYLDTLLDAPGVTLPVVLEGAEPVWHLFVITTDVRDQLHDQLAKDGLQTLIHYPIPPFRQGAYPNHPQMERLPVADRLSKQVLSLPIGPHLTLDAATDAANMIIEAMHSIRI